MQREIHDTSAGTVDLRASSMRLGCAAASRDLPDITGSLARRRNPDRNRAAAPIRARARALDSDAGTPVRIPAIERSTPAGCTHYIRGSVRANLLHVQAARVDKWEVEALVAA